MLQLRSWAAAGLAVLSLAVTPGVAAAAPGCPSAGFTIVESKASPQTRAVKDRRGHRIFLRREALTVTADITEIKLDLDRYDTGLQLKFKPEAAARLHAATTNQEGLRLAFVVDDDVVAAFTWTGPYGMDADVGVQLSLGQSEPRIRPLAEAIRKCIAASPG
jgi:preprotein translocase subunit SecD